MLKLVTDKIVLQLVNNECISETQEEQYRYGLLCLIEYVICISSLLLIGAGAKKFFSTMIFIIFFVELKKRCGGLHAGSFLTCWVCTCMIYMSFVTYISRVMLENMKASIAVLIVSFMILEIIGAVENTAIGWSREEHMECMIASRLVCLSELFIIVFLKCMGARQEVLIYMAFSIILNAMILMIAKVLEYGKK